MKNRKFLIIVIIVIVVVLIGSFIRAQSSTIPVGETTLQNEVVSRSISASGEIHSIKEADLSFSMSGPVEIMNVAKGDKVSAGTLLAKINNNSLIHAAQASKDARDITLRNKDLFVDQYEKNKKDIGGETQYDIRIRTLDEQISQAEATYQAQRAQISNTYIYAPFSGTVVDVYTKVGEVALPGSPAVKIAVLEDLVFETSIEQEDFGQLKIGQTAQVSLEAYPNYIFQATVIELPLFVDLSDTFKVKLKLEDDSEHRLLLGMKGDAFIMSSTTGDNVPSLDFDEVFKDDDNGYYIWVLDQQDKIVKFPVEIGLEGDINIHIKTPIEVGTKIVVPVRNGVDLKEGFKAKIIN